ncbi:MAG: hypothetical protein R2861_11090 [Desulfobacterales bacterium]
MKDGMVKTTPAESVTADEKNESRHLPGRSTISIVQMEATRNGHPAGSLGKNNGTRVVDYSWYITMAATPSRPCCLLWKI